MVQESVSVELGVPVVVDPNSIQVKDASSPTEAPTLAFTPYWAYGQWSKCTAGCGDGLQSRSATCYRDALPVPSNDCSLEKDIVQQNCTVYDDCPFDVFCLGQARPDGNCEMKRALVAGGLAWLALVGLCCFCIRKLRKPKRGTYSLGADGRNHQISWMLNMEATPSTSTSAASKTHVVWDVDEDVLRAFESWDDTLEDNNPPLALEDVGVRQPMPHEQEGLAEWEAMRNRDLIDLDIVVVSDSEPSSEFEEEGERGSHSELGITLYENGQVVEYYSATLKRWVRAYVKDIRLEAGELLYDVFVSRQARMDVPLPMLRPHLRRGEPVYLVDGDARVNCVVAGRQCLSCTTSGYQVLRGDPAAGSTDGVDEEGNPFPAIAHVAKGGPLRARLDRVSASRLHRRFPVGSEVEVYRGPMRGWCPATVREELFEAPPSFGARKFRATTLQPYNCSKVRLWERDPCAVPEADGVEAPVGDHARRRSLSDGAPRETEVGTWLVRFSSAFLDRMVEDCEGPPAFENDEAVQEFDVQEVLHEL
eukprot:TRINITY_DN9761_c0_g2_i7.p1 TRINITY_DN9761_c0_g2~~TRINITY_DN9761_c0_g2_i7.p1  ORF type:complete len:535 (+),score=91.64 TRINITY_DN9761_c0_g2_i7:1494-3098(+)